MNTISRYQFLRQLGLSGGALMAVYCGVNGCQSEDEASSLANGDSFTLDQSTSAYSKLKTNGQYVVVNEVVVARTNDGVLVAVTVICSHEGQRQITYDNTEGNFYCTAHGARYDENGTGLNTNGKNGLRTYTVTETGDIITVSA